MSKLTLEQYYDWHLANLGEDLRSDEIKKKYSLNITLAQAGVTAHPFVKESVNILNGLAVEKIFALASETPDFTFGTKPYDSVVDKTYRSNCNWNRVFPREPSSGWIKSTNWFTTLDDLIRTSLVCR